MGCGRAVGRARGNYRVPVNQSGSLDGDGVGRAQIRHDGILDAIMEGAGRRRAAGLGKYSYFCGDGGGSESSAGWMRSALRYPIFLMTGKTGFFSGPPEAVKGARIQSVYR